MVSSKGRADCCTFRRDCLGLFDAEILPFGQYLDHCLLKHFFELRGCRIAAL